MGNSPDVLVTTGCSFGDQKKKRKLKPFFKVSQSNLEIYINNETIEDEKIGE